MIGHRGYYRDGWSAVTVHEPRTPFGDDTWELHDLTADPAQAVDLAADQPQRLAALVEAWDNGRMGEPGVPARRGFRPAMDRATSVGATSLPRPVRITAGTPTLERYRSAALINSRSFHVDIDVDAGPDDDGVLLAHGDQGGGYAVYVESGSLRFAYNAYGDTTTIDCGAAPEGRSRITLDMEAPGNLRWHVSLGVDGDHRAAQRDLVMLTAMAPFEGIDVGIDRRSPVSWDLYARRGPFPYTGTIDAVTYVPGEPAPDAGVRWIEYLREVGARFE